MSSSDLGVGQWGNGGGRGYYVGYYKTGTAIAYKVKCCTCVPVSKKVCYSWAWGLRLKVMTCGTIL